MIIDKQSQKYYIVNNKYLAEGLAFLGFRYYKMGEGKETKYSFEDTEKLKDSIKKLLKIKKDIELN